MNTYKVDLSPDFRQIELIPFADLHIGDKNSDRERILRDIGYIRDHENVFTILHGDLMNCAIKTAVSDIYTETLSPMDELRICQDLFGPIRDKIIFVCPGNHEERHYKTNGIDITGLMCEQLGISDRYCPTTGFIFLRFGENEDGALRHRPVLYSVKTYFQKPRSC